MNDWDSKNPQDEDGDLLFFFWLRNRQGERWLEKAGFVVGFFFPAVVSCKPDIMLALHLYIPA